MPFKVAVETLQNRASDSPLCVSLSFTILSIHRTTTLHAGIRLYLPLNIVVAETQHSTRRQFSLHQFICPSSSYRPHRVLHQVLTQLTSSCSHGEQSPSASIITRCWLADDVQSTQLFESIHPVHMGLLHSFRVFLRQSRNYDHYPSAATHYIITSSTSSTWVKVGNNNHNILTHEARPP